MTMTTSSEGGNKGRRRDKKRALSRSRLKVDEVVDECRVVAVGDVHDTAHHRVHVLLREARHEAEVEHRELALALVVEAEEVARLWRGGAGGRKKRDNLSESRVIERFG